jgi:hypothetical protein
MKKKKNERENEEEEENEQNETRKDIALRDPFPLCVSAAAAAACGDMASRSSPRHRHDGTSPLPLGMDYSPPPSHWVSRPFAFPISSSSLRLFPGSLLLLPALPPFSLRFCLGCYLMTRSICLGCYFDDHIDLSRMLF